jgi:NhaA family Na+:H+ antiporter
MPTLKKRILENLRNFLRLGAAGGILLVAAATVAVLLENSPLRPLNDSLLDLPMVIRVGGFEIYTE